jgi:hypothetical protein
MLALDIDPRTRSITPQPFTVRLDLEKVFSKRTDAVKAAPRARLQRVEGELPLERIYTPDFLVELVSGVPLVVEAKSAAEVQRIGTALARRGSVLNALGFRYLVVASTEVDDRGLHSNLVHMRDAMKYQRDNNSQPLVDRLVELVADNHAPFPLGEIKGKVPDICIYLGLILGVVGCDLRTGNLGVDTVLWLAHGDLAHLQLLRLED